MSSSNWVKDIERQIQKYGTHDWVAENPDKLEDFLKFRIKFLEEELNEAKKAFNEGNNEEIVDAMVDLCVVAIGNLLIFGVDADEAWNRVYKANMQKEVGMKSTRPNKLGLPDLIKPEGWVAPQHSDNVGYLPKTNNVKMETRRAVSVLAECMALMEKKGQDYNGGVKQTEYYPNGLKDIFYMMHHKMTRMKSLLHNADHTEPNFESMGDTAKDLINYSAFFVEYAEGKMDGQQ